MESRGRKRGNMRTPEKATGESPIALSWIKHSRMRCWNTKVMCRSANSINVQNYACKLLKAPYTERYVLVLWEGEAVRDRQLYPIQLL